MWRRMSRKSLPSEYGFDKQLFADRVVLITAAGGAIGAATARIIAACGGKLMLADSNAERLDALAEELTQQSNEVVTMVADITQQPVVGEIVEAAVARWGRVDVLINGVGEYLGSAGPFEASTEDAWQALYEVNLLHVFRMTQAVLPGMKERGYGKIVNFSSVEGIRAAPNLAVYGAFKRAIDGFTRSLAVEVAPFGVGINAVAVDKTRAYQVGHYALPERYESLIPTWIPAGHYADAEEVARITVFLASDLNSWIVGDTITADGGTLAAGGWYRTPERWTNQPLLTQYFEDPAVNEDRPPSLR